MDINLTVPKEQRCFECVDNIDRISKLPDEILGKILNYLPTKQAVATSILSKRWEYLWTLTSDLDFSDDWLDYYNDENDYMIEMRSFQKYVDRVIFYHGASNIRKCDMSFSCKYITSSLYTWIFAMMTCNVQELSLEYFESVYPTYYQLPWRIFSCNMIVVLRIGGDFLIDLPKYVCFPCLKLLKLSSVVYVDDASMQRFFSSCPVLEELTISRMHDFLEIMNIFVPSLKRLCIYNHGHRTIQVNINTPCLEYVQIFHHETNAPNRYFVNFTSTLVQADLSCFDILLLRAISHVEYLILTGNDTSLQDIIRDSALPVFKNLKTLKLRLGWPTERAWKLLPNLLDSSPNLQVLIFPQGLIPFTIAIEDFLHFDWPQPESVSECLSMHLKTVEIFEFVGFQEELDIVEYFLHSAKVLEKMIIHRLDPSKHPKMGKRVEGDKVMSELLSLRRNCSSSQVMNFKRSSSICEVIFTD